MYFNVLLVVICCFQSNNIVDAHGRLIGPPSRSSMWRFGFNTPKNYGDNGLFCGGKQVQYKINGGKCGFCGDRYDGDRPNEAGGKYATGTIAKTYNQGSTIDVVIEITAHHKGWSQFKLCRNDNYLKKVTQECLDKHLLPLASDPSVTRHMLSPGKGKKTYTLQLPKDLTCSQCVLQWQYHTGNSWGIGPDGKGCLGCGPVQEEFYGCSDIAIKGSASWTTPPPPPPFTDKTRKPRTKRPSSKSTSTYTKSPTAAPPTTGKRCYAFSNTAVDNSWCNTNCNEPEPFCPGMLCYCSNTPPYSGKDENGEAQMQRLINLLKWLLSGPYGMKRGKTGY